MSGRWETLGRTSEGMECDEPRSASCRPAATKPTRKLSAGLYGSTYEHFGARKAGNVLCGVRWPDQRRRAGRSNSVVYIVMPNNYKNAKVDLTTTDATVLYTCPAATTSLVKSILASEDSGNADTITVTITDADAAVFSLFKVKAVAANTTVELLTAPLVVQENEILKVTAATANRLHVVASFLEVS